MPGYGYEEIQLARFQQRLGHEVTIVASNYLHPPGIFYGVLRERFPRRQVEPCEEQVDGVTVVRLPAIEIERRVWLRGMARRLRELQPDIVHAHNLMQFHSVRAALMRATRRASFGLLVDDHMLFSVMRTGLAGRSMYLGYRRLLGPIVRRNVDRFCAATEESRDYLQRVCGVRGEIPVVPLGVDTERFAPSAQLREQWRERLGLRPNDLVVLYTGKLISSKRLSDLVEAVLSLRRQQPEVRLLLVGDADPAYRESLVSMVRAAGDQQGVVIHASLPHDELPGVYAASDIAVWPGTESMAVFEALAMALPVIVTDESAYADLVSRAGGARFRAGDSSSLAAAISAFLPQARRAIAGRRGRELAVSNYSWARSAERYLSVYMEILGGRTVR